MYKTINFDMDGTIANLYAIDNWETKLNNCDPSPYKNAAPLLNMNILARYLNILTKQGYKINIISWCSKQNNIEYNHKIENAKKYWLRKHLKSVKFNHIHVVPYGTPKHSLEQGILFDDEERNRKNWQGKAYTENEIFNVLRSLI